MCFCSSLLSSVATAKGIIHGLGFARWTLGRRMGGCFLAGPPAFASVSDTRGGGGGGRLPGFPKYRGSVTKRFFVTLLGFFSLGAFSPFKGVACYYKRRKGRRLQSQGKLNP